MPHTERPAPSTPTKLNSLNRKLIPQFVVGRPVQTVFITVILAVFGVALITQSSRWYATPA